MTSKSLLCTLSLLFLLISFSNAQSIWKESKPPQSALKSKSRNQLPLQYRLLALNNAALKNMLETIEIENKCLEIPLPKGGFECFIIKPTAVMPPVLAAKYSDIQTFNGRSRNNPASALSLVMTPDEFHVMVYTEQGIIFIDKVESEGKPYYMSYFKKDKIKTPVYCHTDDLEFDKKERTSHNAIKKPIPPIERSLGQSANPYELGSELRTYRFALAFDGAVTQALGGVSAGVLRAATIVSDLNVLLEKQLCMRLELIPNNEELIFPDPDTAPYTGSGLDNWLNENRIYLKDSIGSANFDLGHVINTSSGGVAYVGVTCFDNWKGGGTSPNDIEILAHEIGHQLGASHTFNYCGGSGGGYEPGSGNTSMSYWGLCPGDNMPGGELLQYHTSSYDLMAQYRIDYGNACGTGTATGNTPPSITVPNSGFTIPISTPFTLRGSVTDDSGLSSLSYLWEQNNLGSNSTSPQNPTGNAPIFRSLPYSSDNSRTFPEWSKIINGTFDIGEVLPTYSRDLTFRLMVLDNDPNGGGVNYEEVQFQVEETAGPFEVEVPNGSSSVWSPGSTRTVEWNTANTELAPVNCSTVNILASFDGGYTYPDTLAVGVANDGSQEITVPSTAGTQTRIKVEAADNIFFDISNEDFEIVPANSSDFILEVNPSLRNFCDESSTTFEINTFALGVYSNSIDLTISGLPVDVTSNLPIRVSSTSSTSLNLGNLQAIPLGHYPMTITATEVGGSLEYSQNIYLILQDTPEGISGNAMSFDGDDAIVIPEMGDDYQFGIDRDFSVDFWMKTTSTSSFKVMVGKKDFSNTRKKGWLFTMRSGKVWFLLGDDADRLIVGAPNASNDGEWHHIAGVLSRAGTEAARLYVDGELVTEETNLALGSISNDQIISIGADSELNDNFSGTLDEIRIWRKALSEAEIRENMHRTLDTCTFDLISNFQFNESSGDVLDPVGFYNGTVTGATRISSNSPIGTGTVDSKVEASGLVSFAKADFSANYISHDNANVTATKINLAPSGDTGIPPSESVLDNQYWVINRYEQTGSFTADFKFKVTETISAEEELNPSNLKLYYRPFNAASDWTFLANASLASASDNTLTFPSISNYGQFLISRLGSLVPLELLNFEASPKEKTIDLQWTTVQEVEVAGYEILRSEDNVQSWQTIGWMESENLMEQNQYHFKDQNIRVNNTYYYQLKMRDWDGQFTFSNIRSAKIGKSNNITVSPTLANREIQILIESDRNDLLEMTIYDALGRLQFQDQREKSVDYFQTTLDVSNLPGGIYWLKLGFKNSREYEMVRFVKMSNP